KFKVKSVFLDIRFRLWFIALINLPYNPSYAQSEDVFESNKLPKASQYTYKNWFDVKNVGHQAPFDKDKVVIFGDEITIEEFDLERIGGQAKHVLIIADAIRLGKDNKITMESSPIYNYPFLTEKNKFFEEVGGSFIVICCRIVSKFYFKIRIDNKLTAYENTTIYY